MPTAKEWFIDWWKMWAWLPVLIPLFAALEGALKWWVALALSAVIGTSLLLFIRYLESRDEWWVAGGAIVGIALLFFCSVWFFGG